MTIAVHIELGDTSDEVKNQYNYQCFSRIAANRPSDHFIFIFDKPFHPSLVSSPNITAVLLGPALKNRLLRHYWYQFKLPRLLSRYQASLFINQDKMACLRTNTEQYLVIEDMDYLDNPKAYTKSERRYLKKYFPQFISKAGGIITLNSHTEKQLLESYPAAAEKIISLFPGIDHCEQTITSDKQERIHELTEGAAYFVFLHTAHSTGNSIMVLKAFSIFKKWQRSNMKLIVLSAAPGIQPVIPTFENYKYRDDVKIITAESDTETCHILSGAYAAICLPESGIPEKEPAMALACGVPLIISQMTFHESVFGEAALYATMDEQSVSEKMMRLYKDESLRKSLIRTGLEKSAKQSWENAAIACQDALLGQKGLTFAIQ